MPGADPAGSLASMTVLQKAVTPALAHAYLAEGYDRVSGYVVRAAEVSDVITPAGLRELHLLDHAGSRYPAGGPLHILHVDQSPSWQLVPATSEHVVERDALDPSGSVEVADRLVPVFLLGHTRLTSGARLWRFTEDAPPELVGTYLGPALGWQDHDGALKVITPTASTGAVVVLEDTAFVADVTSGPDGAPTAITAVAPAEPPAHLGFQRNVHGFWVRGVEHAEARALFEVRIIGTWRGHPVQVVQQFRLPADQLAARICSLAHDWTRAEAAGFLEVELGVWEATVPADEIRDTQTQELAPRPWMTAWQRERFRQLEQASRSNTLAPAIRTDGFAPAPAPGGRGASAPAGAAPAGAPPVPGTVLSPPGEGVRDAAHQALYQRIAQGTIPHLPTGAREVQLLCESVGNVMEVSAQAVMEDDTPARVPTVSEDVARAFGELRVLGARGPEGPWFGALVRITAAGQFTITFNRTSRPRMKRAITAEMLRLERERFPRPEWPEWFLELEQGPSQPQ